MRQRDDPEQEAAPQPTGSPDRAAIPILGSFSGESFTVHEFTLAPDDESVTLATERDYPVGTRGSLRFRVTRFDEPFVIQGEVAGQAVGDRPESPPGLSIRLLEVSPRDRQRLHQIASGVAGGSVVESLRASLRESPARIDVELRRRPTDFKMMLALHATGEEIEALIRDGNPSVVIRLLQNPRLGAMHVRAILGNPNMPGSVLGLIARQSKWMANQDIRQLFCVHPGAMISQALAALAMLTPERIDQIATNMNVRIQVRTRAAELLRRRALASPGTGGAGRAGGAGSTGSRSPRR